MRLLSGTPVPCIPRVLKLRASAPCLDSGGQGGRCTAANRKLGNGLPLGQARSLSIQTIFSSCPFQKMVSISGIEKNFWVSDLGSSH